MLPVNRFCRRASLQCGHSGFTLLELVVVIAIISMVMMIVLPRLPSSEAEQLKVSARTLAATLRYAQERAATARTTYYLMISPGTEHVQFQEAGGDGGLQAPADPLLQKTLLKDGIVIADTRIPRLGVIRDGQLKIEIGSGGLRDFVTIHLRASTGSFRTVMAFPAGGKVREYDGYLEDPP